MNTLASERQKKTQLASDPPEEGVRGPNKEGHSLKSTDPEQHRLGRLTAAPLFPCQ